MDGQQTEDVIKIVIKNLTSEELISLSYKDIMNLICRAYQLGRENALKEIKK